jgi:hypothetical protein
MAGKPVVVAKKYLVQVLWRATLTLSFSFKAPGPNFSKK